MDKTFQHFSDRMVQNPEHVVRYEFKGRPLLYSDSDEIGKKLSSGMPAHDHTGFDSKVCIPRCTNCGGFRVFEFQLVPQAITELENDAEMLVDGMDWGTILVGVCERDCQERGKEGEEGKVGYIEEWIGVQWEELTESGKTG